CLCFTLGATVSSVKWYLSPHVTVRVRNDTDNLLTKVGITFTGGRCHVEGLPPHRQGAWGIRASNESAIVLRDTDAARRVKSKNDNAYIEPGYRGSLDFRVGHDGVRVVNRIKAFPNPRWP